MSLRHIPEKYISQCDLCGEEAEGKSQTGWGNLIIKQDALDYQGAPVADGTKNWLLCRQCLRQINDYIPRLFSDIKAGLKP